MSDRKPLGIKIVGIILLIFSFIAAYVNLVNIIAVGRPLLKYITTIFITTDLFILIQSIVYFIMSILSFINAIHILRLKSYAVKELFVLIIIGTILYFLTNFLIEKNLFLVLKDSVFGILTGLMLIYYFTRPKIKKEFRGHNT
jgi:hypothetical protein